MDNPIDDEKENQHNQLEEREEKIQHIYPPGHNKRKSVFVNFLYDKNFF
jgi:hypothetical protein